MKLKIIFFLSLTILETQFILPSENAAESSSVKKTEAQINDEIDDIASIKTTPAGRIYFDLLIKKRSSASDASSMQTTSTLSTNSSSVSTSYSSSAVRNNRQSEDDFQDWLDELCQAQTSSSTLTTSTASSQVSEEKKSK